jgi:hypothetical protein
VARARLFAESPRQSHGRPEMAVIGNALRYSSVIK